LTLGLPPQHFGPRRLDSRHFRPRRLHACRFHACRFRSRRFDPHRFGSLDLLPHRLETFRFAPCRFLLPIRLLGEVRHRPIGGLLERRPIRAIAALETSRRRLVPARRDLLRARLPAARNGRPLRRYRRNGDGPLDRRGLRRGHTRRSRRRGSRRRQRTQAHGDVGYLRPAVLPREAQARQPESVATEG
jgi:hypothetical protein